MYKEEYEALESLVKEKFITEVDLINKIDRTLLYGYTCERHTWHVYIENGEIHTVIYKFECKPEERIVKSNEGYVPDKRLYPETCDYEFCRLLKEQGVWLPFTTWQDRPEKKIYYGERL